MADLTSAVRSATTHARRWWILAVLCLSVLLAAIDNTIVNVALPTLSRQIGASTSDLQWVVDAYTVAFASLLLVCGNIGDRLGRRRVLQVGLVLFALASLAAALSTTVDQLIAARAAMGVCVALVYPTTLAMLPAVFVDRQERAVAIGVWSGVSGLAIALGPVVGGLLLEHYGWWSIFLVNLPVVALALVLGAVLLPESRDPSPGRFDVAGALLSVASVSLLVWTVIEAPTRGWTSWTVEAGFAGAAILVVGFVLLEARSDNPLLDVRLFRNARFSAASATISIAFFGLFGFIFMITMYFQLVRGYSTLRAGAATLPYAAVMGVLSPLAILAARKIGTKAVVGGGMLLMAAGFLVAARASVTADYWGVVVVSMCLMAAGMALATGPSTDSVLAALPESRAGVGSAVNDTTRELGGALGVAVVGSVMSWYYGSQLAQAWTGLGVAPATLQSGRTSLAAGLAAAGPDPALAGAVRSSFMAGLHAGSFTAAAAALLAALAALLFLPQHDAPATAAVADGPTTGIPDRIAAASGAARPSAAPVPSRARSERPQPGPAEVVRS